MIPLNEAFLLDQSLPLPWGNERKKGRFLLKDLLGENYLHCYFRGYRDNPYSAGNSTFAAFCSTELMNTMTLTSLKYPGSFVVKGLINFLSSSGFLLLTADRPITDLTPQKPRDNVAVTDLYYPLYAYAATMSDEEFANYINHLYMTSNAVSGVDFVRSYILEVEDGSDTGILSF